MTNKTKPDSAAPGGDVKQWLLKVMGEWDFSIPVGAFDAISSMLKSVTDEQYADAEALIAHLDELHDDGGQGGEKWEPAQAAIAGIKAWQAALSAPKQKWVHGHRTMDDFVAPKQSDSVRDALVLFRRAKEWIASDSYDGIDARGRALLEQADEAAKVALSAPQPVEAEGREGNFVSRWSKVIRELPMGAEGREVPPPGSYEAAMVVIERDSNGTPTIWCDPEVVDLVTALNTNRLRTVASCSGHGHRPGFIALKDGRVLLVCASLDEAQKADHVWPDINGNTRTPERPAIDLEQFRPAVEAVKRYGDLLHAEGDLLPEQYDDWMEKADHLLAIIDGAKAGRAEGES